MTISIGGNDVDGCPTQPDPTGCVKANMPKAITNLTKIVKQLRAAGGKQMRIIGSTYPDVELGLWVHPTVLGPNTLALVPGSISAGLHLDVLLRRDLRHPHEDARVPHHRRA